MKILALWIVVVALSASACANSASKVPINGLVAALHFCLADCKVVRMGPSTKQLSYRAADDLYDHWCVEVFVEQDGKTRQSAVEIMQVKKEDGPFSWAYMPPIYNSDCKAFK